METADHVPDRSAARGTVSRTIGEIAVARPQARHKMTFDEYLAWEQTQEQRWEFVNGDVFAMTGATVGHERVSRALANLIGRRLPAGCEVFTGNMKVRVHAGNEDHGRYPDLVVTCERPADEASYLTSPVLIAEVLSPSTESADRGSKFTYYRLIPSLREYLLVNLRLRSVELYRRRDDQWHMRVYHSADTLEIESVDVSLAVADLFSAVAPAA